MEEEVGEQLKVTNGRSRTGECWLKLQITNNKSQTILKSQIPMTNGGARVDVVFARMLKH
jgi:hypothetical protein